VDGRVRVAVALKALWHIDAGSVVLIHDWPHRVGAYGRLLLYYDIVDEVDELVVLASKAEVDWDAAAADLARYVNHPARRACNWKGMREKWWGFQSLRWSSSVTQLQ